MSILGNDHGSDQDGRKGQSKKCINFGIIPVDDLDWILTQKPSVMQLFIECWRCDPYGSRWMQLSTKLKPSAFREAKKQLTKQGLFVFKRETSIQDSRSTVCWMIKNLHGSRVKDFWKAVNPMELDATHTELDATHMELVATNTAINATYMAAISPQNQSQSGVQSRSISSQNLKRSRSSSISPRAESGEEELKNFEKTKEEEANQDNGKPEGVCTPESQASLIDKSETIAQPKDLDGPVCSGARRENENQSHATEDAPILKWLVEKKIPSMELNDPPRNVEAYAKAMIKRDGDTLRAEFAELLGDRRFREECLTLTEKVEARVEEWWQAGHRPSIFFDFDGRPQVRLDLTTISAADFLAKPIEQLPLTVPATSVNFLEQVQTRKMWQSRLKAIAALGECPGFEFLAECWGDVMLRSQVRVLIAKYPQWGIFVDSADQLQSWFD